MRGLGRTFWLIALVAMLGCQAAAPASPPAAPAAALPTAAAPSAPIGSATEAPAAGGMPAPLNPPVTVKVGLLSSISDSGVYIGYERGYYRDLGLDLDLETIPDPNAIGQLVNSDHLDVGGYGVNANPFMAAARGIGVKIVADKGSLRPGFGFSQAIARQDLWESGQLRSPADLRGR